MPFSKQNRIQIIKFSRQAAWLLLCLLLTFAFLPPVTQQAYPVTSAEKQAEADEMVKQLDAIQTQIVQTETALQEATAAEATALALMEDAQQREEQAVQRTAELQAQLGERAVETYRNGNVDFLEVLFGASSFAEFITSWDMINRLNDYDLQLTENSKSNRKEADNAQQLYTEQELIATQKKNEIIELKASLEQTSAEMQDQITKLTEEAAELLAQEEAAAEAARIAAAAAASAGANVSPELIAAIGKMIHPCPGASISSTFGWRSFDNSFHMGLDLAAGTGTPIYAAASGTVIISGYSSSAGNWVVISHGNGMVTKYMHASALYVSAGQAVSAGQPIAAVGNTGNSFGAHLHFQLEINGSAVDPYPFIY